MEEQKIENAEATPPSPTKTPTLSSSRHDKDNQGGDNAQSMKQAQLDSSDVNESFYSPKQAHGSKDDTDVVGKEETSSPKQNGDKNEQGEKEEPSRRASAAPAEVLITPPSPEGKKSKDEAVDEEAKARESQEKALRKAARKEEKKKQKSDEKARKKAQEEEEERKRKEEEEAARKKAEEEREKRLASEKERVRAEKLEKRRAEKRAKKLEKIEQLKREDTALRSQLKREQEEYELKRRRFQEQIDRNAAELQEAEEELEDTESDTDVSDDDNEILEMERKESLQAHHKITPELSPQVGMSRKTSNEQPASASTSASVDQTSPWYAPQQQDTPDTIYNRAKGAVRVAERDVQSFADMTKQKTIVIKKQASDSLGFMITETGRTSLIPSVFVSHIFPGSATARNGQLSVGDTILFVNGVSVVGLPFEQTLKLFEAASKVTDIHLVVVPVDPVMTITIDRAKSPNGKLGFDVLNGQIVSIASGGAAELAGMKPGHHIISINGRSVVDMHHDDILHALTPQIVHIKTMPRDLYTTLIAPSFAEKKK